MIITDIQQQKKNQKRYSVFIDGQFAFSITDIDLLFYKLEPGKELTQEKYDEIFENLLYEKAKEKALKRLNYKYCTKKEIFDRLSEDYSPEITQKVIDVLEKYNYINDMEYARLYISDSIKLKGWGKQKIKFQLKQKGVPSNIIDLALDNSTEDYSEKAASLLLKKFKGADLNEYTTKQKAYNYLLQRGYSYEDISNALEVYNQNLYEQRGD